MSTFRDGSGQQTFRGRTYPGWRDFERAVAAILAGAANEDKGVFDVLVPSDHPLPYGLSCKTSAVARLAAESVLFELHNSNAKAWARIEELGLDPDADPDQVGIALVDQVMEWHLECAQEVDVPTSSYLLLIHDRSTWSHWRLLWFPLVLNDLDPAELEWSRVGKRIQGVDPTTGHRLWEWYGWSGGQLKYYPRVAEARWVSEWFGLDDAPAEDLSAKAAKYFATRWP